MIPALKSDDRALRGRRRTGRPSGRRSSSSRSSSARSWSPSSARPASTCPASSPEPPLRRDAKGAPGGSSGCDALRGNHSPRRVSALPGAADHRQDDPALVRRRRGGLDGLHAVLPAAARRRLPLLALVDPDARAADADDRPHRAARGGCRGATDPSRRELEAGRRSRSQLAHPRAPRGERRSPLLPARDHGPAGTGVVRASQGRRDALPVVRALEPRLDARPGELSVPGRAVAPDALAGARLVGRVRRVRDRVRAARLAKPRAAGRDAAGRRRRAGGAPALRRLCAMGRSRRRRVDPAARVHEPPVAERRPDSVSVGAAARAVSPLVHPLFRRARLVSAKALPAAACRRVRGRLRDAPPRVSTTRRCG